MKEERPARVVVAGAVSNVCNPGLAKQNVLTHGVQSLDKLPENDSSGGNGLGYSLYNKLGASLILDADAPCR